MRVVFVPAGDARLESVRYATLDGSKRRGLWRSSAPEEPNDDDERRSQLHEHWHFVLAALGGCENTRLLLKRIADEELSYRQVAAELGWDPRLVIYHVRRSHAQVRWARRIADLALWRLREDTGFTIDPWMVELASASAGNGDLWAVSIAGACQRYASPVDRCDIAAYLSRYAQRLCDRRSPRLYFGGWIDPSTSEVVFDLTLLVPDEAQAVRLGIRHKQQSIYNLATGQLLYLNAEPGRKAA